MAENIVDKIKLIQRKIKEVGINVVDIEHQQRQTGTRVLIEIGDGDRVEDNETFNMNFDIIITITGLKKEWQTVVKSITLIQKKLQDDLGHQDKIGGITKVDDDSDTIFQLTITTAYTNI